MKSPIDHIQMRLLTIGLTLFAGAFLIPWSIAWALAPVEEVESDQDWEPRPTDVREESERGFDVAAFYIRLVPDLEPVREATKPVAASAPPPKPQPPELTLLGTVLLPDEDDGGMTRVAMLYDIRADAIVFVKDGESVGPHTVESVREDAVRIAVIDDIYTLPLEGQPGWESR